MRQIYESILCMLIQFNFTNIKLWQNLNDDQLISYYNNLNYNNNKKKWQVDIETLRIDFNKAIQDEQFLKLYLKEQYSIHSKNSTVGIKKYKKLENKFSIFKYKALCNGNFYQFNNETSPCLGYDGYNANLKHQKHLNNTLSNFIFKDTNWINMYSNVSINNLLSNNIFCSDSKSVVSFGNNKLNIFYFAVTDGRLDLYTHLTTNICNDEKYEKLLSHYGYQNCSHFLKSIDVIIANQGNVYLDQTYDMSHDLFNDRNRLYQYLYNTRNTSSSNGTNFIPIIATSNWHEPRKSNDSKKIEYYTNISNIDMIDTTSYLNLDSVSQKFYRQTQKLAKFEIHKHFCIPGPTTRYVWLFFEMIDLIFDAIEMQH